MKVDVDLPFVWCPSCPNLTITESRFETDGPTCLTMRNCEHEDICRHAIWEADRYGRNKSV